MKIKDLFEDRYFNQWAKDKAAENRARNKLNAPPKPPKEPKQKPWKPTKPTDAQVWQKLYTVVGDTFPDGDPIDLIGPYMDRYGLTMKDIDRVVNSYQSIKGGYYEWLAQMWDDATADAVHDAKQALAKGQDPEQYGRSPFYHVENDKVVPAQNPWK